MKTSRDQFWRVIEDKYVGISKKDVHSFLYNQESYQVHMQRSDQSKQPQPIVTTAPYQLWAMDLIDMSKHAFWNNWQGHRMYWILTVTDHFTKFGWALPVQDKTKENVLAAFKKVIQSTNNHIPRKLLSDNGAEFKNGDMKEYCRQKEIIQLFTLPYQPCGSIERLNRTLKARIYHHFSQFKTQRWVDVLDKITEGYNDTEHGSTKYKPSELQFPQGKSAQQIATDREIATIFLKGNAERQKKRAPKFEPLHKGDFVRLSVMTEAKKRAQKLEDKKFLPNWLPEIYVVNSISKPTDSFRHEVYTLKSHPAGVLVPRRFLRRDLLKIPSGAPDKVTIPRPNYAPGQPNQERTRGQRRTIAPLPHTQRQVPAPAAPRQPSQRARAPNTQMRDYYQ